MSNANVQKTIAAYATFKQLYTNGNYKSSYLILAEFIKYIIENDKLYSFPLETMVNKLYEHFGFKLPHAVVSAALKKTGNISFDGHEKVYVVDQSLLKHNDEFSDIKTGIDSISGSIISKLIDFVNNEMPKIPVDESELIDSFLSYLLDTDDSSHYSSVISKFILINENDRVMREQLKAIREGSILYSGLSYNINDLGSVSSDLTLFLDTEVLFNLVGYNGNLHKSLADDFISLVKDANRGKQRIYLKYFEDVKDEIDGFFYKAESIVLGKKPVFNTPAMRAILNGCKDPTDVVEKKADFYNTLSVQYGIHLYKDTRFYDKDKYLTNLEGISLDGFDPNDRETQKEIKTVSNVYKLRKGQLFNEYTQSQYLIITETKLLLDVSQAINAELNGPQTNKCGFALRLNAITNILWYKLNRGFGNKTFPSNIDAVLKAKTVLSTLINGNIEKTYNDIQAKHKSGELSDDAVAARIIALKEKAEMPEDLSSDTLNDDLNFDSNYINRYEGELERSRIVLSEKESTIQKMESEYSFKEQLYNDEKDKWKITEDDQRKRIEELEQQLAEKEAFDNKRNRKRKQMLFYFIVILLIVLLAFIAFGIYKLCLYFNLIFSTVISIIIGFIGISGMIIGAYKYLYNRIVPPKD